MPRKRKLDASIPEDIAGAAPDEAPRGAMGGMWAGSAMNLLQKRIESTHGSLVQGILNGTVALELDPSQIEDVAGSDRVGDWEGDEAFEALVANIRRRGQTQPVRVRPKDADWTPGSEAPLKTDAVFIVQSGRRRIEACRRLGRKVLAILSTDTGDAALADLEERFHENTMRENLSGFEELMSIGLIAESLRDLSQEEIAARLGVSQNDVSLGLSCVELRERILAEIDVAATPKRAYRAIIPRLRRGEAMAAPAAGPEPETATGRFAAGRLKVEAKASGRGLVLKVSGADVRGEELDRLAERVAALFRGL
ncbi:ParB N-terminal domain-containing protein [Oceanicella sp. SM1341]|uniref:ParB/RepB/Spo0J family partition protein n=1 Tax=Oceanicella sp. SM1341 TaxID=1548889 RepID=UPI00130068F2|nr:ParB N-terminal domain-containing protein [Oceanicella sp. SM1341]